MDAKKLFNRWLREGCNFLAPDNRECLRCGHIHHAPGAAPERDMEARAQEICTAHIRTPWSTDDYHLRDAIASALQAERKRAIEECAQVADEMAHKHPQIAYRILLTADAIRAMKERA